MHRLPRLTAFTVMLVAAMVLAACGGGNKTTSSSTSSGGGAAAKTGGTMNIDTVGPDSYDPVMIQTTQGNEALHPVYLGLLSYKDTAGPDSATLQPALAEAMPTASNGGKTYKFKLRAGLKYSDGSLVKASDFENTMKRNLLLGAPFSSFYSVIAGSDAFMAKKDPKGHISGITANDQTGEISVTLTAPDSRFLYAIAIVNAALTPTAKSPAKILTSNPPPGAGPYTMTVQNPTRLFTLQRNPNFSVPTVPKGNFDKFTVNISSAIPKQSEDVIAGKADYMTDDPAGDLLPQIQAKYGNRFRLDANPPNVYYFFMDVKVPPFDKLEARQAVNYAIDSRALQRIFGGRLKPSCNFLPEQLKGYKKIDPCPWGDPNGGPDLAKAKALVQQSGTAGQAVTVWGNDKDPRPAIVNYLADTLNQIGYKAKVKLLNQQVYFKTIGAHSLDPQIGFTDWFQDFPHPGDFFEPNVSGTALKSDPTFNNGRTNDPHINSEIARLDQQDPDAASAGWAALDKYLTVDKAYVAVYGSEQKSTFMSERMDFQNCNGTHSVYLHDWLLFCAK
jgi:peptide/nickel transport system substrate-binding protein